MLTGAVSEHSSSAGPNRLDFCTLKQRAELSYLFGRKHLNTSGSHDNQRIFPTCLTSYCGLTSRNVGLADGPLEDSDPPLEWTASLSTKVKTVSTLPHDAGSPKVQARTIGDIGPRGSQVMSRRLIVMGLDPAPPWHPLHLNDLYGHRSRDPFALFGFPVFFCHQIRCLIFDP
ncbi:hypothetical protein LZ30DRAFT_693046 [Colletotrichum cereale]|nr:hypothetical protein LZ30DRAFT_693046 [Colletotrichum cereale]